MYSWTERKIGKPIQLKMAKIIAVSFVTRLLTWLYHARPWMLLHSQVVFAQDLSVPLKGWSLPSEALLGTVDKIIFVQFFYIVTSVPNLMFEFCLVQSSMHSMTFYVSL